MAQSPPWGPPDPHTRVGPTGGRSVQFVAPDGGGAGPCPVLSAAPWPRPSCPGPGRRSSAGGGRRPCSRSRPWPSSPAWCGRRGTTGPRSSTGRWIPARCARCASPGWPGRCSATWPPPTPRSPSWPARFGRRGARAAGTLLVVTVGVAALLPGTVFALVTVRQDTLLDTVFAGSGDVQVAQPSPLADLGITPPMAPTTTASVTVAPTATTDHDHDHPADDRPDDAAARPGAVEHRAPRRRRRAEPLGAAHRHDDRRQHRPPDRRPGQRLGPPQPQAPAHAPRAAARPLPQRLRRPGQRPVHLRLRPGRRSRRGSDRAAAREAWAGAAGCGGPRC